MNFSRYFIGESAKSSFENFKKRYLKKRNALKKTNKSGTSSAVVDKAKKDIEPYKFFSWIDAYLRARSTKTNLPDADMESIASHISNDEPQDDFSEPDNEDADTDKDGMDGDGMRIQEESEKPAQKPSNSKKVKRRQAENKTTTRKYPKLSIVEEKQLLLMDEIENDIVKEREQRTKKSEDAEDTFCASLASELRQFSQEERCLIKHEINNIIFRYQMSKFRPQGNPTYLGNGKQPSYNFYQSSTPQIAAEQQYRRPDVPFSHESSSGSSNDLNFGSPDAARREQFY